MTELAHTISAFNTATESENKIHDDDVARRFGFTGGLVPGVEVFGYMAHVPAAHWGHAWLTRGSMTARFVSPIYDGAEATTTGTLIGARGMKLTVSSGGRTCAEGEAAVYDAGSAPAALSFAPAPRPDRDALPKASPASLIEGAALGSLDEVYSAEDGKAYLADIRETPELFDDGAIAHPGFLLRRANYILMANVKLGPWIHAESAVNFHGLLTDGMAFETCGRVIEVYEKKGHRFVTLDFAITAGDTAIASGRHTAIYEPRQVREP